MILLEEEEKTREVFVVLSFCFSLVCVSEKASRKGRKRRKKERKQAGKKGRKTVAKYQPIRKKESK